MITKEKNIILFTDDETNKVAKFDMNTCTMYGVSGKVVLHIPTIMNKELRHILVEQSYYYNRIKISKYSNVIVGLSALLDRWAISEVEKSFYDDIIKEYFSLLDKLESLSIRLSFNSADHLLYNTHDIKYINEYFKDFVKFMKSTENNINDDFYTYIRDFREWRGYNYLNTILDLTVNDHFTNEMRNELISFYSHIAKGNDYIIKQLPRYKYFLEKGWLEIFDYSGSNTFKNLCNWCESLGIDVPKGEISRVYVDCKRAYTVRKTEFDNKAIKTHQLSVKDKLSFEDNNFTVVIPTTSEEMIKEAENQSNCIARLYLPKVIRKETHIVFIRKKNDIDNSYISCEVDNNGCVIQYLLAHNHRVEKNSIEDKFRISYEEYLRNVWGK